VIHYDPSRLQPEWLVAGFAHELARFLVETFDEPPPGGTPLYEPAIDLATVFIGFGVFMANSAAETARWSLNESELVHALALFCLLHRIEPAALDSHLNPHVRKYLRLAKADLEQYVDRLQYLRAVFGVDSPDHAEQTLPTRR
jgi:hypothetical protein